MSSNLIISGSSALCSILAYKLAKNNPNIDRIPAMIIGGFVGAAIGNEIVSYTHKKRRKKLCK